MNVAALVNAKGSRVVTTRRETPVEALVHRMTAERIGAVVVTRRNDDRIEGMISERDIIRGLAENGPAVLTMRAADLMTRAVRTCAPTDSIKHIMAIMTRSRIRHLPVVQEHRLCGIVSIGDVVKYRLEVMELEINVLRDLCITSHGIAKSFLPFDS
jgi:CBS domain-containing protein